MPKKCVLFAPVADLHAGAVAQALRCHGVSIEWIDLSALNRDLCLSLTLNGGTDARLVTSTGREISLSEAISIWWRGLEAPEEETELDPDHKAFAHGEWQHFLKGIEAFAATRWINSPAAEVRGGVKAFQLVAAKAEGLRVPRTVITNDAEAVASLSRAGDPLVYKRVGSASRPVTATQALLEADMERLDSLKYCPAIFQERIDARYDIRVTAIGPALYAASIDSQHGASPLDWRFDYSVKFEKHNLDKVTEQRLHGVMRRLGLVYAAIDLRLTPEGEYVFLEVNPHGQFLFVELLIGIPLSERMAEFLAHQKG